MSLLNDILEEERVQPVEATPMETAEPTGQDKELTLTVQVDELKAKMEAVVIKDQKEYEDACEWLKGVKKIAKEVKAYYEPKKKELYAPYKEVLDKMKRLNDILTACERGVKAKIADYAKAQEAKAREEQKKAEEERAALEEAAPEVKAGEQKTIGFTDPLAGLGPAPKIPPKIPPKAPSNTSCVVLKEVWKWELEDISKVPMEYLMLDESKIGGVVRSLKGDTKIAGIRVFADKQVSA